MKKLNLGCGEDKKEGYINVDWNPLTKPDLVYDLNVLPYPFEGGQFDLIEAFHVLEHLDKPFTIMKEFHRLLKPGGILHIKVPHFSRGFTHAEHSHGFDITFPLYFNNYFTRLGYLGFDFKLEKMSLKYLAFLHLLPYLGYKKPSINILKAVTKIVSFLANLSPAFCSRVWCYWVGGFDEIEFTFICNK
jgi:SAM-dependent methyltransferase